MFFFENKNSFGLRFSGLLVSRFLKSATKTATKMKNFSIQPKFSISSKKYLYLELIQLQVQYTNIKHKGEMIF